TFKTFFRPYAILVGLTAITLFTMHGAIYLVMKTEGELHDHLLKWIKPVIFAFIFFYILTTIATIFNYPHMTDVLIQKPYLFIFPLLALISIINVIIQMRKG